MEKFFLIPESLRKGLIDYLSEKPYKEVATGIARLVALEEVQELPNTALDSGVERNEAAPVQGHELQQTSGCSRIAKLQGGD